MDIIKPVDNFTKHSPFGDTFWTKLEAMATGVHQFLEIQPAIKQRLAKMDPMPPTPGDASDIWSVGRVINAPPEGDCLTRQYTVEYVDGRQFKTQDLAPINRPFCPLSYVKAVIGDLVTIFWENGVPHLVQMTERVDPGACPNDPPPGFAEAGSPQTIGIGPSGTGSYLLSETYKSGLGLPDAIDFLMANAVKLRGTATMVAGEVVVNIAAVTANSQIHLTPQNSSGVAGSVYVSARVAGTSFTITSTSVGDTRDVAWMLI
jgi:hypothetical protein